MKEVVQRTLCNSRVRDIKIDLLIGNKNPIIDLFCEITSGIEIVNCNVYNEKGLEFIYHKDGKWIFFQDVKNGKFWCSNARYWTLFTSKFDLSYEEIQAITKYLVEEALKREVNTTKLYGLTQQLVVEEALEKEIGTPKNAVYSKRKKVDEALKQELGTPIGNFFIEPNLVQEVLKKELSTPTYADGTVNVDLEEVLKREVSTQSITYVYN